MVDVFCFAIPQFWMASLVEELSGPAYAALMRATHLHGLERTGGFRPGPVNLGLSTPQVLQKIMADPELAMAFSNPKVQEAVMDVSQNPMNIVKYQNEPDVLKVHPFPSLPSLKY